jgi:aminoglycoside phosphotransferase (APT) family kinase protein
VNLPPTVPISAAAFEAIAARHGLGRPTPVVLPSIGIINVVYALDDGHVLRVPRNHPAHIAQAFREAAACPLAVAAGVRTPALVGFDASLEILPVPYLVVDRVHGVDLESVGLEPPRPEATWRDLGRDLGLLHVRANPTDPALAALGELAGFPSGDPRALIGPRVDDGWLSPLEGRWLERWLDALAPRATGPVPLRLVHGDLQMANVLVDARTGDYRALIDWGCARPADGACDLGAVPMRAVPLLLAGHREIAALDRDDDAEARIVWHRLRTLLAVLPRGAAPGCSWAERPVAWMVDLLGFFASVGDDRWVTLGPCSEGEGRLARRHRPLTGGP